MRMWWIELEKPSYHHEGMANKRKSKQNTRSPQTQHHRDTRPMLATVCLWTSLLCGRNESIYLSTVIGSLFLAAKTIPTKTCQKNDYYLFLEKKKNWPSDQETQSYETGQCSRTTPSYQSEHKGTNLYYRWNNCNGLKANVTCVSGFGWVSHRVLAAPPSVCHKWEPVLFLESPSEWQSVPGTLCRVWCKVVLIMEAVKIKVCLFLLRGWREKCVLTVLKWE